MRRVLVFADYFLPGFKAGGPVRTLKNMVDHLKGDFKFYFITRDRDLGDQVSYGGFRTNQWLCQEQYMIFYIESLKFKELYDAIIQVKYDVIYLNSHFSPLTIKVLVLQKLGLLLQTPVVICPRGELSPGALSLSRTRKLAFVSASKMAGLYAKVRWQATTIYEEADIRKIYGDDVSVTVAPDLPPLVVGNSVERTRRKEQGHLRILFLSRISTIKNLSGALSILRDVSGNVQFDIYGPLEDELYWTQCTDMMKELPPCIRARYCGVVTSDRVYDIMLEYDLFFLPTLGENFGHVILEALLCGCPVLISDRTPWRNLEKIGAGWDVSLDRPDVYREVIERCISMNQDEFQEMSFYAKKLGFEYTSNKENVKKNKLLLDV